MFQLVGIGLGSFWLYCAYVIQTNGADTATVYFMYGLGGLVLIAAVVGLFRNLAAAGNRARTAGGGWRDDGEKGIPEPAFDADAAIARYQAQKAAEAGTKENIGPAASGFGRKSV